MVKLGTGMILHLSQACLGEVKKGKGHESVCLFVNVDGKKLVLGTLSPEKLPQQLFDLVFDRDFELTHNWKNGSVFFYGYKANKSYDETGNEDESESESEEDIPLVAANNGKPSTQVKQEKLVAAEKANAVMDSAAGKQKVKIVELNKDVTTEDDDEVSSDDNDVMCRDSSEDDDENSDDSDDVVDDDEDDEETSKKVHLSKKRALESASKTTVVDKKAKLVTPKKTDGKKGNVHVDTPHPLKQARKTPANTSNLQTPKSEGSHYCKSCNRSFKSETALDSHNKAKHIAGK